VQLLKDIFTWFDDIDGSSTRIFWLNGLAGTGKTTVARSVAALVQEQHRLAAAFFFSRNDASTRDAAVVIPTIAYQLATRHLVFRPLICTALISDPDVRDRAIAKQVQILLSNLAGSTAPTRPLLVIIDALDECNPGDREEDMEVLHHLIDTVVSLPFLKLLVTSRVERNIKDMFASLHTTKLALHYDIEEHIVQSDIHTYFQRKFAELARTRHLQIPFPSREELSELVDRAGTLFIFAATVFKYIADRDDDPLLRLQRTLRQTPNEVPYQYKALDMMYSHIICEAATTTGDPERHAYDLHSVLATVIVSQESLPLSAIAGLADINEEETKVILQRLSSVFLVDNDSPVRLYHPSFPDFITDSKRCRDGVQRFLVVPTEVHMTLACRCLELINNELRKDMCDIKDPALLNREVSDLQHRLSQAAPHQLRYACKFWLVHLRLAGTPSADVMDRLVLFTQKHLLHWLEMLSLMDELSVVQCDVPPLLAHLNVSRNFYNFADIINS
jgi:hypothetical protein